MSKYIVIAEKPSVGKDIARVLGCKKSGNGYVEGDKYVVTWALGHLVTLADPDKYDKKYSEWNLSHLPILVDKFELEVIGQTSKQYKIVKQLLYRKDISAIIIATDAGREGELVARWILEKSNCKKSVKRLWISSVTDRAIIEGFNNLKDGRNYENLYKAASARAEADWIVGINATRALTTKYNAQLSCGRVQTPTLSIISQRDEEIRKFIPKKYYGINVRANNIEFTWIKNGVDMREFDLERCKTIALSLKNSNLDVIDVQKKHKKKYSQPLYDLTELQRDANNMFGYSAKETLSIMQRLYEYHKVLTYPRTDSRYISSDIIGTIKDRLNAITLVTYKPFIKNILKDKIIPGMHFVDNKKVTDHHAIIPTEQKAVYSDLSDSEKKIYNLVIKRFLAVLLPAFEYEETNIKVQKDKEVFIASGKVVKVKGYRELYVDMDSTDGQSDIKEQVLPDIKKGDVLIISDVKISENTTKPPSYFNEATLLSAMENPSKYVDDKSIGKTLGETGGLGTVATRADIIEKLFSSFVIEKRNRSIYITSKGKQLLELVPVELKSPELTGQWEQKLDKISKGELNAYDFIREIKIYTQKAVDNIKQDTHKFKHNNITTHKCPNCEKLLLEVESKKGRMLVCQDRQCRYKKHLSMLTNSSCPKCRKKLEIVGEGEGRRFICKCGFREKYERFVENRSNQSNSMNKKEVQNFLLSQNKKEEKSVNSSIANALSKLKF